MTVTQQNRGERRGQGVERDGRALWWGQLRRLSLGLAGKLCAVKKSHVHCTTLGEGTTQTGKIGRLHYIQVYKCFRRSDCFLYLHSESGSLGTWFLDTKRALMNSKCPRAVVGCFWWPLSVLSHSGETPHLWFSMELHQGATHLLIPEHPCLRES